MYAATSELAALCRILGHEFPGSYYAPHHRGYGVNALDNYDEMLQVGRVTSCPIREYSSSNFESDTHNQILHMLR
jgi:N-acyl-D-amino-acid deacylase